MSCVFYVLIFGTAQNLMGFLHTREVEVAVVLPDLHKTKQNLSLRILLWTSVFKMCMLSGLLKLSTFVFCYNNCFSLFIPEGIFGVQTHKAAPPSLLIFLVDSIEKNATLVNGFMWLFGQKYLSTLREKKKKYWNQNQNQVFCQVGCHWTKSLPGILVHNDKHSSRSRK